MKFLQIAVLFALIGNLILLLHISRINDNLEFMYRWNIVKTIRANDFEARIKLLEQKFTHETNK